MIKEIEQQTQRKHVPALLNRLGIQLTLCKSLLCQLGHGCSNHIIRRQRIIEQWIGMVSGHLQRLLQESVGIQNQRGPNFGPFQICLQRGGVHRNQYIEEIARRKDFSFSYMNLIARYSCHRILGCANLGRIVGECREIITTVCGHFRKKRTNQLHPVAGVAGKLHH